MKDFEKVTTSVAVGVIILDEIRTDLWHVQTPTPFDTVVTSLACALCITGVMVSFISYVRRCM